MLQVPVYLHTLRQYGQVLGPFLQAYRAVLESPPSGLPGKEIQPRTRRTGYGEKTYDLQASDEGVTRASAAR